MGIMELRAGNCTGSVLRGLQRYFMFRLGIDADKGVQNNTVTVKELKRSYHNMGI